MTVFTSALDIDANFKPIYRGRLPFRTKKTLTFAGATANAWGNNGGTLDGGAVFTVTGLVELQVFGLCTTDLVGGSTVEVGVTGGTAIFCAQITDTVLDEDEIYLQDTTPATSFLVGAEEQEAANNLPSYMLSGLDVILTTGGSDTTSGVIDFFALWAPMSDDGNVVDAGN